MSFLFDKLFQKQNPALAAQMSRRGLIFDKNRHRWVKRPDHKDTKETKSESFNPSSDHEFMQDIATRKAVQTLETQMKGEINPEKAAFAAGQLWLNMESARKEFKTKEDFQRSVAILTAANKKGIPHYKYWDKTGAGAPGGTKIKKLHGVQNLHRDEWDNLLDMNKFTDRKGEFGKIGKKYSKHVDQSTGKSILQEVNLTNEKGYKLKGGDRKAKYSEVGKLVDSGKQALWEDLYSSQPTPKLTTGKLSMWDWKN